MFVLIERSFLGGRSIDVFSSGDCVTSQFCVSTEICDRTKFSCDVPVCRTYCNYWMKDGRSSDVLIPMS